MTARSTWTIPNTPFSSAHCNNYTRGSSTEPRASGRWTIDERCRVTLPTNVRVDSPHPTVVVDSGGNVISANALARTMLGREGEDLSGWSFEKLVGFAAPLPHHCATMDPDDGDLAILSPSTFAERVQQANGSRLAVEVSCSHIQTDNECYTLIHLCDVSRRHEAAVRLQQLSSALEQIDDHAVITDFAGIILYVNRAFEEVSGYKREFAIGKTMNIVKSGKHDQAFYLNLWRILRAGEVFRGEIVNRNARGDLYIDEQRISPFTDGRTGDTYYIATGRDVTERRFRDPLTGLPTRAALLDRIEHAATRDARHPSPYGLVFLDLDRFRTVNAAHGVGAGDAVLVEVGDRIRHTIRKLDSVAQVSHLDRDEFAILLEELHGIEDARRVAQRLLDAISAPVTLANGDRVVVTASIGIALPTSKETSPEALLLEAESAMRRAKAMPDDPCQVFDLAMHQRAQARLRLETELRSAVFGCELVLEYQPIVSLHTGQITGCEALVRWDHPTRGRLQPTEFIPVAEETGCIVSLGEQVLMLACREASAWRRLRTQPIAVAVNVSVRQLIDEKFVRTVERTLDEARLPPELLKLEVTESAVAQDPDRVIDVLQQLKGLGVQLLIDDFGTGHSSLNRLTQFPIDKLKIDRSFVWQLPQNPHACAVASTIIAMAHSLRMGVIAEGVETIEQALFLRKLTCQEMQGFLFSKPVSATDFERLVATGQLLELPAERVQ